MKRERLEKYATELETKITQMHDDGVLIFLDSLEDWSVIETSSSHYLTHQSSYKARSIIELGIFLIIGSLELLYLWKVLQV